MARASAMASPPATTRLSSLPDGVVSVVLACLFAPDDIRKPLGNYIPTWPPTHVVEFASVCRAWSALVDEIFSANALINFDVALTNPTRSNTVELRRQLTLRRAHTQRVNLKQAPNVHHMDGVALWTSLLCQAPHAKLADLTRDLEQSRACPTQFLVAAGANLPRVHSLHLPPYQMQDSVSDRMDTMPNALFKALELWFARGHCGGVRELRWSRSIAFNSFESARRMAETLATYCPQLQTLESKDGLTDQWNLDLKSWTLFCQSCTSLTEFNWGRVPFATLFFEIFGQITKPQLTKLTLGAAEDWDWDSYMREAPPVGRVQLESRGFGGTAKGVCAVLKVCPNLRELLVEWKFYRRASASKMDPEMFGDDFHEELVASCPFLEQYTSFGIYSESEKRPMIETLTDRSLYALAKLPRLEFVEMSAKNITGDAVFDLVVNPDAQLPWAKRDFRILVGDSVRRGYSRRSSTVVPFYHILLRFLERLASQEDHRAVQSRPVSLWLVNHSHMTAGKTWYKAYLAQLKALVARIKQKMPEVFMEISLVQEGHSWSHQIASFGFYTPHGETAEWEDCSFLDREGLYDHERIDSVFIRRYMRPPSDQESEEEEDVHGEISSGDDWDGVSDDHGEDDDADSDMEDY